METQAKKKIGLIGAILMGIGCIVGTRPYGGYCPYQTIGY